MSSPSRPGESIAMTVSLLVSLLLMFLPIDMDWLQWQPEWAVMVFGFWLLNSPGQLGYWHGLVFGLVLDLLMFQTLGSYALSFVVLVWVSKNIQVTAATRSMVQSMLLIGVYVAVVRAIRYYLLDDGYFPESYYAVISSVFLWPAVMLMLRKWIRQGS